MDLQKEIEKAQNRSAKATYLEAKKELSEETYPLMLAFYEEYAERMEDLEGTVAELINQAGSYLQENLSTQIQATLEIGRKLASDVASYLEKTSGVDDITRKTLTEDVAAFMAAAQVTSTTVAEITLGESEDAEEGEEDAEEGGEEE